MQKKRGRPPKVAKWNPLIKTSDRHEIVVTDDPAVLNKSASCEAMLRTAAKTNGVEPWVFTVRPLNSREQMLTLADTDQKDAIIDACKIGIVEILSPDGKHTDPAEVKDLVERLQLSVVSALGVYIINKSMGDNDPFGGN